MKDDIVLALYSYSGNIVRPWAEAGYETYAVDIKHDGEVVEEVGDGEIHYVEADVRDYLPPRANYKMVFAAPPCTNLAVSGARWFKDKGLDGLSDAIEMVEYARRIAEWADAPFMIENPVSTLSTYWRKPDYTFHPYEYDGYTDTDEAYSKNTCLWVGNGFVMPETDSAEEYDDRIHKMPPSDDRSEKRSEFPSGMARAIFEANRD